MSADRAALIQPGWGCGPERPLAWPSTTSTGGREWARSFTTPRLVIDEVGYRILDEEARSLLFEVTAIPVSPSSPRRSC